MGDVRCWRYLRCVIGFSLDWAETQVESRPRAVVAAHLEFKLAFSAQGGDGSLYGLPVGWVDKFHPASKCRWCVGYRVAEQATQKFAPANVAACLFMSPDAKTGTFKCSQKVPVSDT